MIDPSLVSLQLPGVRIEDGLGGERGTFADPAATMGIDLQVQLTGHQDLLDRPVPLPMGTVALEAPPDVTRVIPAPYRGPVIPGPRDRIVHDTPSRTDFPVVDVFQ